MVVRRLRMAETGVQFSSGPLMNNKFPFQQIKELEKNGLITVRDLLRYFPHRYEDLSQITPIKKVQANQIITIQGKIIEISNQRTIKKRMHLTRALIQDKTGLIRVVWFNQPFITRNIKVNQEISLAGKVLAGSDGLYLSNPDYEKILSQSESAGDISLETPIENLLKKSEYQSGPHFLRHTGRIIPIYPETKKITSRFLRYLISLIIPQINHLIKDYLPSEIIQRQKLLPLAEAVRQIHFPDNFRLLEKARRRLSFDELFLIQLFVLKEKITWQQEKSIAIKFDQDLIQDFIKHLPFQLTSSQKKAAWEILQDLSRSQPMNRLLEGDVGSGKTIIAAIAALQAMAAGYQVALMAPTSLLAEQHYQELLKNFQKYPFSIALLTSSQTKIWPTRKITKKNLLNKIIQGRVNLIIGTHSLIQEKVRFHNLALAIIDEQHRFGVQQRAALQNNIKKIQDKTPSLIPHLLSISATPIPRTLSLTIYGNLDISILDEMPRNRQPITTQLFLSHQREQVYQKIRQEIKVGHQVFIVCPKIEAGEKKILQSNYSDKNLTKRQKQKLIWQEVKAAEEEYQKLSEKIFPDLRVALIHGQMKDKDKEKIMSDFKNRHYDILVSTSVIEVGIDISNATIMVIENAERFGLAQLHQLRGRVSRSPHPAYCFLLTNSSHPSPRLKAIIRCRNGFELAEKDLEIRGPGEFIGQRQWGSPDFSMASLNDLDLIKSVRQEAKKILQQDKSLEKYPLLKRKLNDFSQKIHLE